ncbi:MAG: 3-deoxy-8-phosphooctulonate synthase [Alphaproteobacteria bacterium]
MTQSNIVSVNENLKIGNELPFVLLAGPCALESEEHALFMAKELKAITDKLGIGFLYKTSFDKANRTSLNARRGVGLEAALPIFKRIKDEIGCPIVTDVHSEEHCRILAEAGTIDMLQIPAFLCRQTDLLVAAAKSGLVVNVKKGQFLAPWDMVHVANKLKESGSDRILVCDRGTSFGYNTLITDMRGLPTMARDTGCPIVYDATHSVQQPGGKGGSSGGQREFVPVLSRAAASVGIAALFVETHDNPDIAVSDGPNMLHLKDMEAFLKTIQAFDALAKADPVQI